MVGWVRLLTRGRMPAIGCRSRPTLMEAAPLARWRRGGARFQIGRRLGEADGGPSQPELTSPSRRRQAARVGIVRGRQDLAGGVLPGARTQRTGLWSPVGPPLLSSRHHPPPHPSLDSAKTTGIKIQGGTHHPPLSPLPTTEPRDGSIKEHERGDWMRWSMLRKRASVCAYSWPCCGCTMVRGEQEEYLCYNQSLDLHGHWHL